jgi:hypothetical protein
MPKTRNSVSTKPKYCSMSGAAVMAVGAKDWMNLRHRRDHDEVAEGHADEEQQRAGHHQRQHQLLLVRIQPRRDEGPDLVQHTGSTTRKAAISVIFSGTRMGEITLVAISLVPAGRCATIGAPAGRTARPRAGPQGQRAEGDADGDQRADQAVAQLDQVRDEGRFGAGQFVRDPCLGSSGMGAMLMGASGPAAGSAPRAPRPTAPWCGCRCAACTTAAWRRA